jgi:hypothetical protein
VAGTLPGTPCCRWGREYSSSNKYLGEGWREVRWLELCQGHPVAGEVEYSSSNKYLGEGWREVRWLELCKGHPVAGEVEYSSSNKYLGEGWRK